MKEFVYTIVDYPQFNMESGNYKAKSPLSAAKKVFTQLQKKYNLNNNSQEKQYIEFTLRNKSTNKFYTYLGTKVLLARPYRLTQGGKTRLINHRHLLARKPSVLNIETINKLVNSYNRYNN